MINDNIIRVTSVLYNAPPFSTTKTTKEMQFGTLFHNHIENLFYSSNDYSPQELVDVANQLNVNAFEYVDNVYNNIIEILKINNAKLIDREQRLNLKFNSKNNEGFVILSGQYDYLAYSEVNDRYLILDLKTNKNPTVDKKYNLQLSAYCYLDKVVNNRQSCEYLAYIVSIKKGVYFKRSGLDLKKDWQSYEEKLQENTKKYYQLEI